MYIHVHTYMHTYAKHCMYKQFNEWCLIHHPEKIDWTWIVSMFRNIDHNFLTALSWENCKWHFKMDDYYKMIVSKNFSHLTEIKFRCLKLTTWQPSGLAQLHSPVMRTPISRLHVERQMNSMKLCRSLKWRRTPFPFLDAKTWIILKWRLHVIELDEMKRFIYLAFLLWTIF